MVMFVSVHGTAPTFAGENMLFTSILLKFIRQRMAVVVCALSLFSMAAHAYLPPESTPAEHTAQAATRPLVAVTATGKRVVAAGLRGNIVYSDDAGKTWVQANVPVSIDLVAVTFSSSQTGWAVGHSGVVLKTTDGGGSWIVQLDGKSAAEQSVRYYEGLPDAPQGLLEQEKSQLELAQAGSAPPFLDVYFENDESGYVVGAFNRVFHTVDGGKTWEPWMHRVDNPDALHFYAIRRAGKAIYLAGEQGYVWKLADGEQRFTQVRTPYKGTLFGIVSQDEEVVVFGMRGNAFQSVNEGKTWQRLSLPTRAGISSATLVGGRLLFATLSGELLRQVDDKLDFKALRVDNPLSSYFGIAGLSDASFAVVGPVGIAVTAEQTSHQIKNTQVEN
ncbi:WD40/YVTN/BNR-like repeat-containing protein [Pseudomonas sp. H11T01]|uniref:WD40/YVTN/BNR-like repeat-containing protein n=1 Tax=Pseudomonas sp. H11T01 TaxID=3402749 RepID=UPI003AC2C595